MGHAAMKENRSRSRPESRPRIYAMPFARVYPLYVEKARRKGRTKTEVDEIIHWLTGHTSKSLTTAMDADLETFFAQVPVWQPKAKEIKGVICGVRLEEIDDETMWRIRCLDKLIDELAKGKTMQQILRE